MRGFTVNTFRLDIGSYKVLIASSLTAILLGALLNIVEDPIFISAVLLAILLLPLFCIYIEIGLYMIVLALPLQHLEREILGAVGVSPFDLIVWIWILAYGIRMLLYKPIFQKNKVYILLLAWLVATFISGFAAQNIVSWMVTSVSRVIHAATLILTYNILSQHHEILRRIIKLYIGVSIFVVIFAVLQITKILPYQVVDPFSANLIGSSEGYRIGGFLGNPNYMASYLAVPIFLSWASFTSTRSIRRCCYLLIVIILFAATIFTLSRAGFLGIALGALTLFIEKKKGIRKFILGAVVMTLLIWSLFSIYNKVNESTSRSGAIAAVLHGNVDQADRSFRARFILAQMSIEMFKSSPIIGVGVGQFQLQVPNFIVKSYPYDKILNAHNTYLQILAEMGLVGLITFALLFGHIILDAIKTKLSFGVLARPLTGALAGLIALCVFGVWHEMIRSEIWFVAGLVLAYTELLKVPNQVAISLS